MSASAFYHPSSITQKPASFFSPLALAQVQLQFSLIRTELHLSLRHWWTSGGLRLLFFYGFVGKSSSPRLWHQLPLPWRGQWDKNDTANCEAQSKLFQSQRECSSRTNTAPNHTWGFPRVRAPEVWLGPNKPVGEQKIGKEEQAQR